MIESGDLRGENDALRQLNQQLLRRALDCEQACAAFTRGEKALRRNDGSRKQAKEALRESRDLFEEAQSIAHLGSWTSGIEPNDGLVWSRECYKIFGLPEGSPMTVELFFSYVHPADRERVQRASRDSTELDVPYDIEHRVQRPDGLVIWVHGRTVVERDSKGRPRRLFGTVQDVTARHLAVEALEASELRYRRVVENTSEGVWMYDAQGITTFMNVRLAGLLGCSVADAVGQSIYAFIDQANRPAAEARMARRQRGIAERLETALLRSDGAALWTSIQTNPLFDSQGQFEGGLALVTDISVQRRADEMQARLVAIVESSEDAILSANLDGTITTWNRAAEGLYQYSAEEMLGKSLFFLVSPALVDKERDLLRAAARGEAVRQHETERRRKDGSTIEVSMTVSPVRDAAGQSFGDLQDRARLDRRSTDRGRPAPHRGAI